MIARRARTYASIAFGAACVARVRVDLATLLAPSRRAEPKSLRGGRESLWVAAFSRDINRAQSSRALAPEVPDSVALYPLRTLGTCLATPLRLIVAVIAFALMSQFALGQGNSLSDGGRAWVQKIFPVALDHFFPVEHAEGDFIAVRTHQEGLNEVPEYSFVLEDTQDAHALHATIREARGVSLFDQLLSLHAKDPQKSFEDLKPAIKVQEWQLSAAQCPALAAQLAAYQNITFVRPRDDDPVAEHPILYEFHESVGGSDSEAVEYVESRAFPQWAGATRKAVAACLPAKSQ